MALPDFATGQKKYLLKLIDNARTDFTIGFIKKKKRLPKNVDNLYFTTK